MRGGRQGFGRVSAEPNALVLTATPDAIRCPSELEIPICRDVLKYLLWQRMGVRLNGTGLL